MLSPPIKAFVQARYAKDGALLLPSLCLCAAPPVPSPPLPPLPSPALPRTFSSVGSLVFSSLAPHLLFCCLSYFLLSCLCCLSCLSCLVLRFSVSRTFASLASCLLSFPFPFHVVDGCPFLSFQLYDATHLFNASFRSPNMFTTAVIFSFVSLIALMAKRHEAPMNMYLLAAFTCCEAYTLGV